MPAPDQRSNTQHPGPARHQDERVDDAVEDSFPASDPPSHTPTGRSGTPERSGEAEHHHPKGQPDGDRHAAETAAGRIEGVNPPHHKDR